MKKVKSVPCAHIADYYDFMWLNQPCIGFNILRHGYRQWSEGQIKHYMNNLFPIKKNPPRTVKQILVRDFNWRIGNLRRWYGGKYTFDDDIQPLIDIAVSKQMFREQGRHELRLWGESMNLPPFDNIHANARWALDYENRGD